jgi:hypothetical protein
LTALCTSPIFSDLPRKQFGFDKLWTTEAEYRTTYQAANDIDMSCNSFEAIYQKDWLHLAHFHASLPYQLAEIYGKYLQTALDPVETASAAGMGGDMLEEMRDCAMEAAGNFRVYL